MWRHGGCAGDVGPGIRLLESQTSEQQPYGLLVRMIGRPPTVHQTSTETPGDRCERGRKVDADADGSELDIPESFERTMEDVYGEAGIAWVRSVPAFLRECAERWSLQLEQRFEPLSYNYVMRATAANGQKLVLKAGFPCRELTCEIEALRLYD